MRKKVLGYLKQCTVKFSKCLLVLFMVLLQMNLSEDIIRAVGSLGPAPEVTVKFSYKSGGIVPTDNKGNNIANTVSYLFGRKEKP